MLPDGAYRFEDNNTPKKSSVILPFYNPAGRTCEQMDRDERDEFIGKLKRWKYEGCSILVVGDALDLLRGTSELLLGESGNDRYRIFVRTDAELGSVYDRLPAASGSALRNQTKILDYDSVPRSAVTATTTEQARIPEVPVSGGLDRLYDEITETMAEFEFRNDGLPASALRLSFDTLRPVLAEHDLEEVRRWLHHVDSATKSYGGITHYLLPKPYTSETVRQLQGQFEAVIEVEPYDDEGARRKERWHVPNADITTPWRAMDGERRGMM